MTTIDHELEEFVKDVNIYISSAFTDGSLRWMSKKLLDKLEYEFEEIHNKQLSMIYEDPSIVDEILKTLFHDRENVVDLPVKLISKSGKIYSMKLNSITYYDQNLQKRYSHCFFTDKTNEYHLHNLVFRLVNLLQNGIIIFNVVDLEDPGKLVFEFVNKKADIITGGNVTGFVGKTLGEAFPDFVNTGFAKKYLECYKNGESKDLGTIEYGDSHIKKQVFNIECIPFVNGNRIIIHYYSLTMRHEVKESLMRSVSQTQIDILNKKSVNEIVANILRDIITLTNSEIGYVAEIQTDNTTGQEYLDFIGVFSENNVVEDTIRDGKSCVLKKCGGDEIFNLALDKNKKGLPFICDDVQSDPRHCGYPDKHPRVHTYLAMPLLFQGKCIGQLAVANSKIGYDFSIINELEPLLIICANIVSSYALSKNEEKLQKQVEIEQEQKKIAEEITKTKDTFLANMSHELKTLLNGIVGMSQLLMDTEMSLTQSDYTNTIYQCSVQLLAIINDILDFSKMEAGRISLHKDIFNLRECIEEAYDVIALKASKKGLNISYLLEQSVPASIIGDKARVKQVLINLLENAIKFTEKGEVFTNIDVVNTENGKYTLKFSIHDTGIGIEANKKDMIFDIFTQAHADVTTKKYPGTGLGLPICRHLVDLMGGELWVDSVYGNGSVFHFTVIVDENTDTSSHSINDRDPVLIGKRVLIVDDNATNRTIICSTVLKWKMKPIMCGSAEEALVFINSGYQFDLGLLDIQMPGISGIMLAQEIRKKKSNMPLIALSSLGNDCNIVNNDLFVSILNKPIKDSRLYNTCVNVLRPNIKVKYNKDLVLHSNISYKSTKILLAEDIIFNQKVAIGLLNKLGYNHVDIVSNGIGVMEKIKGGSYDVIFMDLIMEPMDGFQTTRDIVRLIPEKNDRPFIVAMTAQTTDTIKEKCYSVGMDGFISKPVVLKELGTMLEIIEESLELRKKGKQDTIVI